MKKIAALLALVLSLSLLCACASAEDLINTEGSWPVVKEPYDVSICFVAQGDGVDLSEYYFTAYVDYLSGLKIEWSCIDASARTERPEVVPRKMRPLS